MSSVVVAGLEPGYVMQRAAALVNQGSGHQVLLLHAEPTWDGDPSLDVDGHTVRVRGCVSHLAVLDEYDQLPDNEYLLVLTDRTAQDLGDAVLLRAWRRRVEQPDLWSAVPSMFGAQETSRDLRTVGTWVPSALLAHVPTSGWPPVRGVEVTAEHALGNLLAHLLGRSLPEKPDAALVLATLDEAAARTRWRAVDPQLRSDLVAWVEDRLGVDIALSLRVGAHDSPVTPLAVGLVVATLCEAVGDGSERGLATGRLIERHLDGVPLSDPDARIVGDTCRSVVRRRLVSEPENARNALAQAEALLKDLGWAEGAATSDLLPAGLTQSIRDLGAALGQSAADAENALARVTAHALARPDGANIIAARMAVRLARWLETDEPDTPTLAASLRWQVRDGAWVDRAVNAVWSGSGDGQVSQDFAELIDKVRVRRSARDKCASDQLAAHAASPHPVAGAVPVERLLVDVVKPWSIGDGVLLVVLDGMSTAVATEIVEGAAEVGLAEWVPDSGERISAIAALPSLTEISRSTLFQGALTVGRGPDEKRGFAEQLPGAPLFHKDDLRADAGAQLPDAVAAAIDDTVGKPVVGLVINTIDDTLHKQDVATMQWTLDRLAPLRALLFAASNAGRTVVLTADHGHVVERSSEARPGNQPRWRLPVSGPAGEGEVLVSGPRVLVDGGEAVLLWREDVHYGSRHPGYHGGASLAEVTIPVVVLQRAFTSGGEQPTGVKGWAAAPPQAPEWWNEPTRAARSAAPIEPPAKAKPSRAPDPQQDALFDVATPREPEGTTVSGADLVDSVLASPVYVAQKERAGRRRPDDVVVAAVLRALMSREGRAHRETLAAAAGLAVHVVEPTLAAIKRVLNVEGYPVIEEDADRVTIRLDVALLRDQFGV